ncbi:Mbeg1-like protein [Neobacillus citreus]|uniref:DUF2974 domain-containing protein n=1 Tax=Neobacillus citreus TaxID=2833578 RepID=A0A942YB77_9BACI|nr:Mbeg1-like protein [Neobacillus citreus]MCH6268199.1 DUF2974 domain-containing protein [Neobacillus citreus]
MADKTALTEQELKFATDIAYLDLELLKDKSRKNIPGSVGAGQSPDNTVGGLLKMKADGSSNYSQGHFDQLTKGKDVGKDQSVSLDAGKINQLPSEAMDWKIVKTFDQNNPGQSGFYGVVIETDKGLIVSFRGSESPSEYQNIQQDWLKADAALISGRLTDQQRDAQRFIDELKKDGYFDKYDNISFAGHSLGGNLAEHATFYAAKLGLADRIDRTISYDGPGHSNDYLEAHKEEIALATSTVQMDHVLQSLVGGILQHADGVNYFYADLVGEGAVQHGTENVHFDENGNIVRTDQPNALSTIISKYITSPFTQGLDRLISPAVGSFLTTALVAITDAGWKLKNALYQDGKMTTAGKILAVTVTVALVVTAIVAGPALLAATVALVEFAFVAIGYVALFVASVIAFEVLSDVADAVAAFAAYVFTDLIPEIIDRVAEGVAQFANWTKKQLTEFRDMLAEKFNHFLGDLKNLFGSGPKAVPTPHIRIDTYKLRAYANRLDSVKARISEVDSKLNYLYLSEGLLDIIHLAIAENLPTKRQMNKVIDYLRDTAADFDEAENRIMSI